MFFLCSVFLILYCVLQCITHHYVTMASISVCLPASGQHDVVLPAQLIMRDRVRGSVGLATVPQQQQPQSQMHSQAVANHAMGPPQMSFLFQS